MDEVPKKRGRPRKNVEKTRNVEKKKNDEENIVCFLALSDDGSEDNNFTINDTETKNRKIDSVTDSDESESDEEYTEKRSFDPETLIDEIKKRDAIISNLRAKTGAVAPHKAMKAINVDYHCTLIAKDDTGEQFKPKATDLHCWWCDHQFSTIPVYIPNSYRGKTYYVFGNFCSFNCAARYNNSMLCDYKAQTRHALLESLKYDTTGSNAPIRFAPFRELLLNKGGTLTIEEFRHGFLIISFDLVMSMPPTLPLVHTIEEVNRSI
jgi:hypothetical protein